MTWLSHIFVLFSNFSGYIMNIDGEGERHRKQDFSIYVIQCINKNFGLLWTDLWINSTSYHTCYHTSNRLNARSVMCIPNSTSFVSRFVFSFANCCICTHTRTHKQANFMPSLVVLAAMNDWLYGLQLHLNRSYMLCVSELFSFSIIFPLLPLRMPSKTKIVKTTTTTTNKIMGNISNF